MFEYVAGSEYYDPAHAFNVAQVWTDAISRAPVSEARDTVLTYCKPGARIVVMDCAATASDDEDKVLRVATLLASLFDGIVAWDHHGFYLGLSEQDGRGNGRLFLSRGPLFFPFTDDVQDLSGGSQ